MPHAYAGNPWRQQIAMSGSNIGAAEAVTPNDAADLPMVAEHGPAQMIYMGAGGDVVMTVDGVDITFNGMVAGVWHAMPPFSRVKATGTTATGIVAGY